MIDYYYFLKMINFNFENFQNVYFPRAMRKNQLYAPKTMRKNVLYAYYEKIVHFVTLAR